MNRSDHNDLEEDRNNSVDVRGKIQTRTVCGLVDFFCSIKIFEALRKPMSKIDELLTVELHRARAVAVNAGCVDSDDGRTAEMDAKSRQTIATGTTEVNTEHTNMPAVRRKTAPRSKTEHANLNHSSQPQKG